MHISGSSPITNGMATVTVDGLECGVTYTIIAGGTLNGDLVGPESSHGTVTTGPCPSNITGNLPSCTHVHMYIHAFYVPCHNRDNCSFV